MEEETFTDILQKRKHSKKHRNESSKELKASNSDTNFIMKREKEKRQISQNILRLKGKHLKNILYKHKHCLNCKNCNSFHKLLKKDKNALSIYIENNLKYLKLFGNQRYNQNSPALFVEDYKKKISEKTMGLVPIPVKKNKTKSVNNHHKLYNLQRSIVMVRRYQYGRKNYGPAPTSNKAYDITLIQRWWKKIARIILIQKCFRGYFIRKQVEAILNLHRFMEHFENIILLLKIKYAFYKIFRSTIIPKKRKPIKGHYIIKERFIVNKKNIKKILIIQNNFRILKAKNKYRKLLREQKFTVVNKIEYISKINYNIDDIFEKIIMIQFNVRKYLRNKNYIEQNIIHKDIGIFYIDKYYIDEYSKKVISFYKLMKHGLQLLAIKKIRSKYKNINDYNKDDINKVIFIQRKYLKHYYNKYIKKLRYNKRNKKAYYINKLRIKDNIDKIKYIQKMYRLYNINKNKYISKIIKNKPIFSSSSTMNISNIPKSLNNNFLYNRNINNKKNNRKNYSFNKKNNINKKNNNYYKDNRISNNNIINSNEGIINNICYISKEYKINVNNKIILLQRKIYSYLFIKNLRYKRYTKSIIKKGFNCNFFITKKYTNEKYCIDQVKKIQKYYKKQYEYMKNNIIKYNLTKSSNDSRRNSKIEYEYDYEESSLQISNKKKFYPKYQIINMVHPKK